MFFIQPSAQDVVRALESWQWLPLDGKTVIRVTAFGDCFLQEESDIWFLDKLDGNLLSVCASEAELDSLLSTAEGQDQYLFAGFVERAAREGRLLNEGQCYDYTVNPMLGGSVSYENVGIRSFVVALHLAGQLHQKIRCLPATAKITGFTIG